MMNPVTKSMTAERTEIRRILGLLLFFAALLGPALAAEATAPGAPGMETLKSLSLEELMQIKVDTVYAASKREQTVNEAPSAVSIVTQEDIKLYGYLQDTVLEDGRQFRIKAPWKF